MLEGLVMPRAWLPRQCAYAPCSATFTPATGRQRYCSPQHSQAQRHATLRHSECAQCGKPLGTNPSRFCDNACRGAYMQLRRRRRGKRVVEPLAVLLPSGCAPTKVLADEFLGAYGEVIRKIYCRRYERCLAYAVSKNWGGFGCQSCEVDEPEAPEPVRNKRGNWEF